MVRGRRYRRQIALRRPAAPMLVALVALLGACGDDGGTGDERADQFESAADEAGLPDEVADVLADAAAGVDGTYRVVYEIADPSSGEPQRVTVTQRPPDRRLDIERSDGTAEATIRDAEATHSCRRDGATGPWTCVGAPAEGSGGVFDADAIVGLADALGRAADDYDFTVETRSLLGVDARCLVTSRKPGVTDPALGESATLCLSPEGAQLLTETPTGTIRAVEYSAEVAEDAFTLPVDEG